MCHIIARTIIIWTTIIAICNYNYNGDHRSRYNHNKPLHTHTTRRIINASTGNNNYDTLKRVAREARNWRRSREHRPDNLRRRRHRRTEDSSENGVSSHCQFPSRNRRNRRAEADSTITFIIIVGATHLITGDMIVLSARTHAVCVG